MDESVYIIVLSCTLLSIIISAVALYNILKSLDVIENRVVPAEELIRRRIRSNLIRILVNQYREDEFRRQTELRKEMHKELNNKIIIINPNNSIAIGIQ